MRTSTAGARHPDAVDAAVQLAAPAVTRRPSLQTRRTAASPSGTSPHFVGLALRARTARGGALYHRSSSRYGLAASASAGAHSGVRLDSSAVVLHRDIP